MFINLLFTFVDRSSRMCALFFVGYLKLLCHGFAEKVRSVDIGAYTTMIHIITTCVLTVDRSHLCYWYGEAGHRASGCTASIPKSPSLWVARSTCGPPVGRNGVLPNEEGKQEEAINSWLCREEEHSGSSVHRRRYQRSGRWPGGVHGFGAVNSYVFSRLIWDGRDVLLSQTIRQNRVALAVVAEAYCIPNGPDRVGDLNGLVAVTWTTAKDPSGVLLDRGSGYVAVEWAGMVLVGVYVSPNSGLAAFEDFLDGVGECVSRYLHR